MPETKNKYATVYPIINLNQNFNHLNQGGINKLEYFAGIVMQSLVALNKYNPVEIANMSIEYANIMLDKLETYYETGELNGDIRVNQ